jgi:REP element-mobilizing transposase RayT
MVHVVSRGNGGMEVFLTEEDKQCFVEHLRTIKRRYPFELFAYCVMPNHVHLLVRIGQYPLPVIAQHLFSTCAQAYNRSHDSKGHVFQGRYFSKSVTTDSQFLAVLRYIHRNPVRAGLAKCCSEWSCSSASEYVGRSKENIADKNFALSMFSRDPVIARRMYCEFVDEVSEKDDLRPDYNDQSGQSLECPGSKSHLHHVSSLEELARKIAAQSGVNLELMRGPSRMQSMVEARRQLVKLAARNGHSWAAIGRFICRSRSAAFRLAAENSRELCNECNV